MARMKNPNHPKKGDTITVEPIRKIEDIKALKRLLSDRPRDLLLFTMGINNGLRIGDLLKLKVKDVQGVKAGDTVRVRIADNGPGIPDEQKRTVFERGEKRPDSEGTGVGLYLVQTLVNAYGGDVWVEDNEPTGSVFVVELPLAD